MRISDWSSDVCSSDLLADDEAALTSIVEPLERRAPAGLPTLRDLQAAFPDVARRIAAIETSQSGDGWTAGVLRRLSQVVNLRPVGLVRSEEHTSELQSLMRNSSAVFCFKQKHSTIL